MRGKNPRAREARQRGGGGGGGGTEILRGARGGALAATVLFMTKTRKTSFQVKEFLNNRCDRGDVM